MCSARVCPFFSQALFEVGGLLLMLDNLDERPHMSGCTNIESVYGSYYRQKIYTKQFSNEVKK